MGEPGFPVAAIERGKQVLVGVNTSFAVGDHDFTKAKLTPSVTLVCDVPDCISESFYRGKVVVTLKYAVFQPSSPSRHAAELEKILVSTEGSVKPILCIYTDGGPDHRTNYLSVQLSMISLFVKHNLDLLLELLHKTATETLLNVSCQF